MLGQIYLNDESEVPTIVHMVVGDRIPLKLYVIALQNHLIIAFKTI